MNLFYIILHPIFCIQIWTLKLCVTWDKKDFVILLIYCYRQISNETLVDHIQHFQNTESLVLPLKAFAVSISAPSFLTDINSACISTAVFLAASKEQIFSGVYLLYNEYIGVWHIQFLSFHKGVALLNSPSVSQNSISGHELPTAVLTPFVCRYHRKLSLPAAIIAYLMNHAYYQRSAYCKRPRFWSYSEVFTTKPSYIL